MILNKSHRTKQFKHTELKIHKKCGFKAYTAGPAGSWRAAGLSKPSLIVNLRFRVRGLNFGVQHPLGELSSNIEEILTQLLGKRVFSAFLSKNPKSATLPGFDSGVGIRGKIGRQTRCRSNFGDQNHPREATGCFSP